MSCHPASTGLVVAFEGLDGTGKTRIARGLAARIGALYYHTPPTPFKSLCEAMRGRSGVETLLVYLSSCAYCVSEHSFQPDKIAVVDRFWFSSVVAYGFKRKLGGDSFRALVHWTLEYLPIPHLTVFLSTERPKRAERLWVRSRETVDKAFDDYWAECFAVASEVLPPAATIHLDTSHGNAELAIELVQGCLRGLTGRSVNTVP